MGTAEESREVRGEDAFDVEAVAAWLATHTEASVRADLVGEPAVRQFPGGASNLTYLLRYPGRDLILRRPPVGAKAAGAHDMGREHLIQHALAPVFDRVPAMVAHCTDLSVLGSEFYVMEKVDGLIPRRELGVEVTAEQASALCRNAFGTLVELHRVDVAGTELAGLGKGTGYVRRQVEGWTRRLEGAATDDLGDWSDITGWLATHQPTDVAHVLVHNDFRLDNLVLDTEDPTQVVAVLDWELATVGDPLLDLGGALAYWVQADDDAFFSAFRRQPSHLPGMWTRAQVVEWYCAAMGYEMTPGRWRFYEVFGLFRLAVIAQQIWKRYALGQTTNEAYAVFGPAVTYLEQRCRRILAGG